MTAILFSIVNTPTYIDGVGMSIIKLHPIVPFFGQCGEWELRWLHFDKDGQQRWRVEEERGST